jgi:hypothetical protein
MAAEMAAASKPAAEISLFIFSLRIAVVSASSAGF